MESNSQERLAKNEAFFREVNERINDVAEGMLGEQAYTFICECSDPKCTERISLTRVEYEEVRAKPARFVIARGHTAPEIEHVVEHEGDHVVVEKLGLAGRIAARLDPRTT
ncbi:MAG TPA: hypothetical protein VGL76_09130 [Gaiellaceae bacterium]|jgi:hypothetical protein